MITNGQFKKVVGLVEGVVTDLRNDVGKIWDAIRADDKLLEELEERAYRMEAILVELVVDLPRGIVRDEVRKAIREIRGDHAAADKTGKA